MQNRLFRQAALDRLSSPERLDEPTRLTTPLSWLSLVAVFGVIGAAALWGVFGRVPMVVSGQGILIRDESIQTVQSPSAGQVMEILVRVGDVVEQNQVVSRLTQANSGRSLDVVSPHAGRVLELRVGRGNVIAAGTTLLTLEQEGRPLEAILYLPAMDGKQVQPGMEVHIAPASVRTERYGLLRGRVATVGEFPATLESMRRVLGSDELARGLSAGGAPIQVEVELLRDERTLSGFQWTTASGPPAALQNGVPCTAGIILTTQTPISLAFASAR